MINTFRYYCENDPDGDKYTMIKWFIQIHDLVNIKTHNKNRFTLEDANRKYLDNNKITINHDRIFKFIKFFEKQFNKCYHIK